MRGLCGIGVGEAGVKYKARFNLSSTRYKVRIKIIGPRIQNVLFLVELIMSVCLTPILPGVLNNEAA